MTSTKNHSRNKKQKREPKKKFPNADKVFALVLLIFGATYSFAHFFSPTRAKTKTAPRLVKANDILKYKTSISQDILNPSSTSSACTLFLKSIAELSINDFASDFVDHQFDKNIQACSGANPTALQVVIDNALLKCQSSTRTKIGPECYNQLILVKTKSVATIIKPEVNPKVLDAIILLQLIAEQFQSGEFLENPEKSLAIIDALLDKEPNYFNGYKVKLLVLSMSSLANQERYKNIFEDTLEEANRLKNNDPEVREIDLAQKCEVFKEFEDAFAHKQNITNFLQYVDHQAALHPKEWIYDYYKANALYDGGKGDYKKTLMTLERALQRAPTDMRLKQTIENLKSNDENRRKHPFSIAIGFSLNDI